jgi:signal peptidase I
MFIALNIFLFVFVTRFFIADFGVVSGPSMEPAFRDGSFFVVSKLPLFFRAPRRFETVQVLNPKQRDSVIVKRVIGLPGESLTFRQNRVCVSAPASPVERCFEEPYLSRQTVTRSRTQTFQKVTIPPGSYFLLGDNRLVSADSRDYGPVKRDSILGLAIAL